MSAQVRERISRIGGAAARVRRRSLGLNGREIAAAAASLLVLIFAIGYYFNSLRPEQQRLKALEEKLKEQQEVINKGQVGMGPSGSSRMDMLKETLDSLERFRHEQLKPESTGIIDLFNQINALAKKNNLKLTSGITMDREQRQDGSELTTGSGKKTSKKKTSDQTTAVFSRAQCEFTVFGSYESIRSFISDLEHSKQFVVLNSMDLKSGEETQQHVGGRRGRAEAAASGLSLSVKITTYFQP
jgi:Tfp pilus assembly protein PilO